jgi:hypothetical protein
LRQNAPADRLAEQAAPLNPQIGEKGYSSQKISFSARLVNASQSSPAQTRMMVVAVPKHSIASAASGAPMQLPKKQKILKGPRTCAIPRNRMRDR